jgi:hypothetical protein
VGAQEKSAKGGFFSLSNLGETGAEIN